MPLTTGASSTAHAETASAVVDAAATDLVALSHDIHSEPELAFHEVRSALKTQRLLAERGFEIVTGQGGMDTAFRATYGHGPLVIGVCAEYDALPGIGHACGHNIIAASAVGTGLGLAEVADALGLTVVVIGTPAEEFGGGKALLLKAGAFDDVAAAVMLHPGPIDMPAPDRLR
ncbi:Putative peptidase/amidohydrolase [Mycobacteroides abscessus]|nr:Putative peptidase/amidohydrolase [Mycobacteroides abscessus]